MFTDSFVISWLSDQAPFSFISCPCSPFLSLSLCISWLSLVSHQPWIPLDYLTSLLPSQTIHLSIHLCYLSSGNPLSFYSLAPLPPLHPLKKFYPHLVDPLKHWLSSAPVHPCLSLRGLPLLLCLWLVFIHLCPISFAYFHFAFLCLLRFRFELRLWWSDWSAFSFRLDLLSCPLSMAARHATHLEAGWGGFGRCRVAPRESDVLLFASISISVFCFGRHCFVLFFSLPLTTLFISFPFSRPLFFMCIAC